MQLWKREVKAAQTQEGKFGRERGNTCVYAAFNFLFYICSTSRINTDVTVPMQQQFNVPALV